MERAQGCQYYRRARRQALQVQPCHPQGGARATGEAAEGGQLGGRGGLADLGAVGSHCSQSLEQAFAPIEWLANF